MASVLFATVGQALGGPLGAVVGSVVGGALDQALLARRPGPGDLLLPRSAYGDALPRLFGRTRVAGMLIWALPLSRRQNGSGRSYVTSFAIALSAGPILSVGRIWADGRELRDADGRFAVTTGFRVHDGRGGGLPDPLIVAAEGADRAPAYAGLAYVVFEDMDLTGFGNRIPALSFEVTADAAGPGAWLDRLTGAGPAGTAVPEALGYVAAASDVREDAALLARAAAADIGYPQGGLQFRTSGRDWLVPLADLVLQAEADGRGPARSVAQEARAASFSLGYLDPDRDYQAGRQRVARGRPGRAIESAAPLTATATMARALATRWLRREEAAAETLELALPWAWIAVAVGDTVRIDGRPERWRVVRRSVVGLVVTLGAERVDEVTGGAPGASDGGRSLGAPLVPAEATLLEAFETPVPLRDGGAAIWLMAGNGEAWDGAEVTLLAGGVESRIGRIVAGAAGGVLAAPLAAGPTDIWDEANAVDLVHAAGSAALQSGSFADVLAGANLLRVGDELVQFRDVAEAGAGRVRLSGLLRGRFATAVPLAGHAVATPVRLVRPDLLLGWPILPDAIGAVQRFLAVGAGDPAGGTLMAVAVEGQGLAPLAPVQLRGERAANGDILCRWVARGRAAFSWAGAEPAMPSCLWRFHVGGAVAVERVVAGASFLLSAAEQLASFGSLLPAGRFDLVAQGDGPETVRTSRSCPV